MSRITAATELSRDQLEDAPEGEWLDKLLEKDNQLGRQIVSNINQSLPMLNSPTSKLVDLQLVHGASVTVRNPLSVPIRSVLAVACIGLSVDSTGKPTRGTYNLAMPQIEWHPSGKQDGSVVIAPAFDRAHETPLLEMSLTSNISLPNNTVQAVVWQSTTNSRGSVISHSAGTFTVSEAGTYAVSYQAALDGGAFTALQVWIETGGNRYGNQNWCDPASGGLNTVAWPLTLAAGGTFVAQAYQINGASAARTIRGDNANRSRIAVQRLYSAAPATGKVTLFFAGGE